MAASARGAASLRRGLPQSELAQRAVDPEPGELLLHPVLAEPGAQALEVDAVDVLVLIETGEHHALDSGLGIAMHLQALCADLLHHALHRRVDGGDRLRSDEHTSE